MKYTLAKLTDVTFEDDFTDSAKMRAESVVRKLGDRAACVYVAIGDNGSVLAVLSVQTPASPAHIRVFDGYPRLDENAGPIP